MLNDFRELEELVFFDLWIPDSGFQIPVSGFWFRFQITAHSPHVPSSHLVSTCTGLSCHKKR